MVRFLSSGCRKGPIHFLVPEFLCSTWQPFLRPDLHIRIAGVPNIAAAIGYSR